MYSKIINVDYKTKINNTTEKTQSIVSKRVALFIADLTLNI